MAERKTFHPFPRLPLEIRLQIWRLASPHGRPISKLSPLDRESTSKRDQALRSLLYACKESHLETLSMYTRIYDRRVVEGPRHYSLINLDRDELNFKCIHDFVHADGTKISIKNVFASCDRLNPGRTLDDFLRMRIDERPSLESLILVVPRQPGSRGIMPSQRDEYLRYLKARLDWSRRMDQHQVVMEQKWGQAEAGKQQWAMPRVLVNIEQLIKHQHNVVVERATDVRHIPNDENAADLIEKWTSMAPYIRLHVDIRLPGQRTDLES